jgi:hypothetical protein
MKSSPPIRFDEHLCFEENKFQVRPLSVDGRLQHGREWLLQLSIWRSYFQNEEDSDSDSRSALRRVRGLFLGLSDVRWE